MQSLEKKTKINLLLPIKDLPLTELEKPGLLQSKKTTKNNGKLIKIRNILFRQKSRRKFSS